MRMAVGMVALALTFTTGCGRQSALPSVDTENVASPADVAGGLPFERVAQEGGISPTSSVIPPGASVPAGTPVTIRLLTSLSSASAHAGDTFAAVLDEPIIVAGQTLVQRGAQVTCRIIDAKAAAALGDPGYLRLALATLFLNGTAVPVRSSSIFAKSSWHRKSKESGHQSSGTGPLLNSAYSESSGGNDTPVDINFGPMHRLTFRLTEPVPLHG
ncbi:MAG TPA: hypothetical protein VEI01_21085 [Terriglobales bacterium]|jgi:hypothetical protein|nr:hypothetical protein [Terriglobales bacterium]